MRHYRKSKDPGGMQAHLYPTWPARGWLVRWECAHCDSTEVTQTVDDAQVAEWSRRLGPWYQE